MRPLLAAVLAAALAAGCGFAAPPPDGPGLHIANATSVPVAVHVNGEWVGTYPAWAESGPVPLIAREAPLRVQLLLSDGTAVGGLHLESPEGPPAGSSSRWISSCGTLVAWVGDRPGDAPTIDPAAPHPPGPPCR